MRPSALAAMRRARSWRPSPGLALLLWCSVSTAQLASAATTAAPPSRPTTVYITVNLIGAGGIDARDRSLTVDCYFTAYWVDASIPANETFDPAVHWWPEIELANRVTREALEVDWVWQNGWYGVPPGLIPTDIDPLTIWSQYARISSEFAQPFEWGAFPQDIQNVSMRIQTPEATREDVVFALLPGTHRTILPANFEIVGWTPVVSAPRTSPATPRAQSNPLRLPAPPCDTIPQVWNAVERNVTRDEALVSELKVYIELRRNSVFWTTRVVANIALMMGVSLLTSSWRPHVPDR